MVREQQVDKEVNQGKRWACNRASVLTRSVPSGIREALPVCDTSLRSCATRVSLVVPKRLFWSSRKPEMDMYNYLMQHTTSLYHNI